MSAICREGHVSDEPDYCSVCGAPIAAGSTPSPSAARSLTPAGTPIPVPRSAVLRGTGAANCPSCGEPREDADSRFCEVCRFERQQIPSLRYGMTNQKRRLRNDNQKNGRMTNQKGAAE